MTANGVFLILIGQSASDGAILHLMAFVYEKFTLGQYNLACENKL